MRESAYQARLIRKLEKLFPGCLVLKNDSSYRQGIPDLTLFYRDRWAMLEVKPSATAPLEPNQDYYVEVLNELSFAAFIYPEIEEDVLYAIQQSFSSRRSTRISQREQLPLDELHGRETRRPVYNRNGCAKRN